MTGRYYLVFDGNLNDFYSLLKEKYQFNYLENNLM
jgi:hypothetical protein